MRILSALGATLLGAALVPLLLPACGAEPEGEPVGEATELITASPAQAVKTMADGLLPGMARYHGTSGPNRAANPTCNNPSLSYFGGPIVQSPIVVPVFWNSNVNAAVQANMTQFYADLMASPYWGWLQEYDTVGLSGGTNQVVLPGTSTAGIVISPVKCPAGTTGTCKLSDTQLQTELVRQIGLGILPPPALDCTGNVETIYMVDFPPNVQLSGPSGTGTSCANNGFCAYHNTGTYGSSNTPLLYGALMDQYSGGCATGCGGNATPLENMTETASHELIEAVTDPDIGLDTQNNYAAPAGWGDNNNDCGEIADICDTGGAGDTITVSGRTWVVQEVWSNKQGKCASTGTTQPVCSGTTTTNCRKCSCGDNGGACASPETCGGGGLAGVCGAAACTPATSCPAGYDCGTAPNGCGGTINCGTCTPPQTCGGGTPSNPNVCGGGCTPACPAGLNCGSAPDGCGGIISCGTCAANQLCSGNVCMNMGSSSSSSTSTSTSSGTSMSTSSGMSTGMGGSGTSSSGVALGGSGTGGSGTPPSGAGTRMPQTYPTEPSSCGCRTAGDPLDGRGYLSALGVLALVGVGRSRRRRAR